MNHHYPLTQQECLEFIRLAIYKDDPIFAKNVAAVIKIFGDSSEDSGEQLWAELSPEEQDRFWGLWLTHPLANSIAARNS
ncbi:hypothetical protein QUA13_00820 [Microcoleus sp. S28C3]|uniref:hypothetical protein n=1 Tax=Microcoleus sp. S28C3 TaxID=3055414 RepID=UPI002FCEE2D8